MTTLNEIREALARHKEEISDRFLVKDLAVFGSYARGDQRVDSDLDILVDFKAPIGVEFIDLADYLERILGLRVDLVSRNGIKPKYYKAISDELKYV